VQLGGGEMQFLAAAQVTAGVIDEWADLAARAVERNPYAEPAFALPALRHLGPDRAGLLLVRSGGVAVAALPVAAGRRWRRVPLPTTAGWRHEHCYLGTPLLDGGDPAAAAGLLVDAMVRRAGRAGAAVLEWIPADGPACRSLLAAARARGARSLWWDRFDRAALVRGDSPVDSRTDHKHRRLRRKARALERDLGPVTVRDRAGDEAAVEAFLGLEASSWKGRESTALGCSPASAEFFRAMCAATRETGQLELLALDAGSTTLALACNLVAGDGVFHFKSAYDEAAARYSPGALLMLDVRDRFDAGPAPLRDSCADPGAPLFEELWPDRVAIGTLVIPSGPATHAVLGPLAAGRRVLRSDDHPS
jgi:CelD/BcsL family acetyltransferase involved in cellulose biosynthesis